MKFNKNEFGWKEKVSVNTDNSDKLDKVEFERMNLYNISSSESLIIQGYPLDMATYREDISNGDVYNRRYINVDKNILNIIDTNKDIIVSIIYEENGKKKIFNQVGYYSSMDYFKNTISLPINNSSISIQVTLFKNKQYNENLELIDSEKCSILLNFGKKDEDTVRLLDSFEYRISIRNANVLTKTNLLEYTPTSDYHPTTKKYVDSKFVMYENIETIYTIPMSEMQKCNNGTSMYVSNIDFDELFINHEKYIYYANYKDETLIPVKYDSKYNRFITDVLDKAGDFNLKLGFDLGTHRMYPFSGGSDEIKAYTFTNDLIIKRVPILDVNEVATKEYVDNNDMRMLEYVYEGNVFKITLTAEQEERLWNLQSGEYIVLDSILPEDIYKCTDTGSIWYGCILINDTSFKVNSFGSLKINNIKSDNAINFCTENTYYNSSTQAGIFRYNYSLAVLNNTEQVVLVKCNDLEYHYASTDYINNILSFNDSGELVVTINGVSKTFVPKPE